MLDSQIDPDDVNDPPAEAYLEWLEETFSYDDMKDGICPSFEEWLDCLDEGDHNPEIDEEDVI